MDGRAKATGPVGGQEEGSQLTNIEVRINKMLDEYQIRGVESHRPRPPRKTVQEVQSKVVVEHTINEDDWVIQ